MKIIYNVKLQLREKLLKKCYFYLNIEVDLSKNKWYIILIKTSKASDTEVKWITDEELVLKENYLIFTVGKFYIANSLSFV